MPVVGELELASSLLHGDMLAVSGTNGKTTTATLLGEIFENAGRITHVAGNIGYPLVRRGDLRQEGRRDRGARCPAFSWRASRPSIPMWRRF